MTTPAATMPSLRAVIMVGDKALASSLELTLLTCGLEPIIVGRATALSSLPLTGRTMLIIDRKLLPADARGAIATLRSGDWSGLAVLMTEESSTLQASFGPAERAVVLEKPFGGAELVALVRREYPA